LDDNGVRDRRLITRVCQHDDGAPCRNALESEQLSRAGGRIGADERVAQKRDHITGDRWRLIDAGSDRPKREVQLLANIQRDRLATVIREGEGVGAAPAKSGKSDGKKHCVMLDPQGHLPTPPNELRFSCGAAAAA